MKSIISFKTIFIAYALTFCLPAQAGFFDSFFGGGKEEEAPKQAAPAPETKTSPDMTDTAIQVATGLIPTLTDSLGITTQQAEGGMGSLLSLAEGNLSSQDFSKLSEGIPGMEALLGAAPSLKGTSAGNIGGLLSNAGGLASSIGGMTQLTQQFEALGLSPDMIIQFANLAIDYLSQEGSGLGDILKQGLDAVLS